MNKAYKDYTINGWWIVASEYYNDWECFPSGMTIEQDEKWKLEQDITFKRLSEVKKWIKTDEAEHLRLKYTQEIKADADEFETLYQALKVEVDKPIRDWSLIHDLAKQLEEMQNRQL